MLDGQKYGVPSRRANIPSWYLWLLSI